MEIITRTRKCDFSKDGKDCSETVAADAEKLKFSRGRLMYELDLCTRHTEAFDKALEPFTSSVDPVSARIGKAAVKVVKGKSGTFTTKDVRIWLQQQGREIGPTGRIPKAFVEEYRLAHSNA